MITAKLRRSGNSFIVTVPKDEVERLELKEGQTVAVEVRPVEVRPVLAPDVRQAFDASWERNQAGYRYLVGR
jgi:antitoxin component of MazEF toxin-antitoxin module